ncbi:hypothetical protein LIER_04282 [Lithospermum erythrorhizon]|uniref:Non-specific serine/threonine protein kinase n=1 Tax=Lithospermum erythrorhizon TaxID=34254 RepID=A0AAV3P0B6_LITER
MPSWLFSLSSLEFIVLNSNQLYGDVPIELSSFVNLQLLDLSSNNFSRYLFKHETTSHSFFFSQQVVFGLSSILPKSIHWLLAI